MWPLSPVSGDSPSTCSVSWSMNVCRRSSPSVTTLRPTPSCMAIAWSTARSSISLYAAASSWPASNCSRASFRYGGRSSDPIVSARYTCAMSGPSFAFDWFRLAVSPAQQRLERLPESLFGLRRPRSTARQPTKPSGRTSTAPDGEIPNAPGKQPPASVRPSVPRPHGHPGPPRAPSAAAGAAARQAAPSGPASSTKFRPNRSSVDSRPPSRSRKTCGARAPGRPADSRGCSCSGGLPGSSTTAGES